MIESGIYAGTLRHRRLLPKRHEFTYPIFLVFLDIDRIPELMQISPLAGYNRANVISYQERDHFGDASLPLRARVEQDAAQNAGRPSNTKSRDCPAAKGSIFLLTQLRYCGYNFNPVSFYYCYGDNQRFGSVLAEVNNTFGETCNYWLTPELEKQTELKQKPEPETLAQPSKRYRFDKAFHVSPFLGSKQLYDWTFTPPGDRVVVECMNFEDGDLAFDSTLSLERREWTRKELHRAILQFPFMTARVIAGIHWQAVRLMLKGVPMVPHPGEGLYMPRNTREIGASWKTR